MGSASPAAMPVHFRPHVTWFLFAVLLQILCLPHGADTKTVPVYFDDSCDKNFKVFAANKITGTNSDVINPKSNVCRMYLFSQSSEHYLLFNVLNMTNPCNKCIVNVYNNMIISPDTKVSGNGWCSGHSINKTSNLTSELSLELDMKTPLCSGNFNFIVTSFRIGKCYQNEIACANGWCIDSSLKCDSINNCADNSDEMHCSHGNSIKAKMHWTLLLAMFVFVI